MAKDKNKNHRRVSKAFVWSLSITGLIFIFLLFLQSADAKTVAKVMNTIEILLSGTLMFLLIWFAIYIIIRIIQDIRKELKE